MKFRVAVRVIRRVGAGHQPRPQTARRALRRLEQRSDRWFLRRRDRAQDAINPRPTYRLRDLFALSDLIL